jgi:Cu+-exporting ATPase
MSYKNRFVFSLVVSLPLLVEMFLAPFGYHIPGGDWGEFLLATAVMLVSAGPFVRSAWAAFKHQHANMDTLVAIGTSTAYLYSIYAMLNHQAVFYESAALVVTLDSAGTSL